MSILYLLLFYPPTKFCQLDIEVHRKTQITFIGVIILRAIQLCLNASVVLSLLWKPLSHAVTGETEQRPLSISRLPSLVLLSLEWGPVRILLSTNCINTNIFKLNSLAIYRCPELMYKGLENDELVQLFSKSST